MTTCKRLLPCWGVLASILCLCTGGQAWSALNRVPNTTLQFPPSPPVLGYVTTNAFGNLSFIDPVAITSPPGETNRLFVVEQRGRVAVITNLATPTRTVFLDLTSRVVGGVPNDERGLLGMAFHPGYATNRYFYVYYSLSTTTPAGSGLHQRLARFETSPTDPNQAPASSETPLLTMFDQANNHNGGDVHFGPDGYLYLSLGDEGGGNDTYNNSQRIDRDFWAGILRLDPDQRLGSLAPNPHPAIHAGTYRVPPDNPFIGVTTFNGSPVNPANVRTEFYAVGLRNPWRMSFDPATGHFYCGDVGQNAWEEIDIISSGGNYGWAYREGLHPGPKTPPAGFTALDPILEYAHGSGTTRGYSVTGGLVYRGSRIPSLFGHYLFADYVTGNIWATRYDGTNATPFQRLTGDANIAGFGTDPANGDVLLADQGEDTLKRLIYTTLAGAALPPTLADTGAFADLASLTPHAGIVPYDVNVPFWSDNAIKTRWFSVPDTNSRIFFRSALPWTFPSTTIWVKHFELEITNGAPASRRRLETRFLVRGATTYGVTYRWDDAQTNAFLVHDEGLDEAFAIADGGAVRTQVWHYPSRTECMVCHTPAVNHALGFDAPQLNRDFNHGGTVENQIRTLADAGYFSNPPESIHALRALVPADDESQSVEQRVRSYLAANCVQCHRAGSFDARLFTPLSHTRLINGAVNDDLGHPDPRVIKPGSLAGSMLLTRISTNGPFRMPPLASTVLDTQAIALVSRWITNDLLRYQSFGDWQTDNWGSTNEPAAQLYADPDGDWAFNWQEYLTGTSPTNGNDVWGLELHRTGPEVEIRYPRAANRGFEVQWSSDPADPRSWRFLDVPENRPFFAVTNGQARVTDLLNPDTTRFYRARVYEP